VSDAGSGSGILRLRRARRDRLIMRLFSLCSWVRPVKNGRLGDPALVLKLSRTFALARLLISTGFGLLTEAAREICQRGTIL